MHDHVKGINSLQLISAFNTLLPADFYHEIIRAFQREETCERQQGPSHRLQTMRGTQHRQDRMPQMHRRIDSQIRGSEEDHPPFRCGDRVFTGIGADT